MAKVTLRDSVIDIPEGESVLQEGILFTMRLFGSNKSRYAFKYVLTDKGIWTRSRKVLFIKSKVGFLAYEDIDHFRVSKYGVNNTYIFTPKNKKSVNRIFFDDSAGAEAIIGRYVEKKERTEK